MATAAPIAKVDSHSAVEAGDAKEQGKKAAGRRASSTTSNAFSMVDLGKFSHQSCYQVNPFAVIWPCELFKCGADFK